VTAHGWGRQECRPQPRPNTLSEPAPPRPAVDVDSTDPAESVHGENVEPGGGAHNNADVEGSGAEVVDHDSGADRYSVAEAEREVRSCGDRLGDVLGIGEAGVGRRLGEQQTPGRPPVGRAGQGHNSRSGAHSAVVLDKHMAQHRGDQLADTEHAGPEQYFMLVDPSLGVGFEVGRG